MTRQRPCLRPEVARFAALMEERRRQRDDRPGGQGQSIGWLFGHLCDEVDELQAALVLVANPASGQSLAETYLKRTAAAVACADIANFAMMMADVRGAPARSPRASRPNRPS